MNKSARSVLPHVRFQTAADRARQIPLNPDPFGLPAVSVDYWAAYLLWKSARGALGKGTCAALLHEFDQVLLVLNRKVELFDLLAQVRIGMAPLGVPFDDFFERGDAAVVHVRSRQGDIANRRRLERSAVF